VIRTLLVLACLCTTAHAGVTRFALVVGNDSGDRDEARLRYAEHDADRVASTLVDLGGFATGNVVTLRGADADAMRAALIGLNDRIRTSGAAETMLVVYYSGHADADALHLGPTALPLVQLEQLVRGSSATFRMLILDSCRSGALTRVKGGQPAAPFPIVLGDSLAADGVVFWTASAASEDAQESDDIKGSFFSHFLVSGLAGPADTDGDGSVTTVEAYEYARAATLRASSRTLAGTQHPTFRDEMRGREAVVLTMPGTVGPKRALIRVPDGRDVLVLLGSADGAVVGEIGLHDKTRRLNVRPGRYFIRERGERYLLEGTIALNAGDDHVLDTRELERVEYARLARKGVTGEARRYGVEAGFAMRTPLVDGGGTCAGAVVAYVVELAWISVAPRIAVCRERANNAFVASSSDELAGDVRVAHAWALGPLSFAAQVQAGGAVLHQQFDTTGSAPSRTVGAFAFGGGGQVGVEVARGIEARLAGEASTYVMRRDEAMTTRWGTTLALRAVLAIGVAF
jgi:caspase domain-containing protein